MRWLFAIPGVLILLVVGISFYLQPNDFIGCGGAPISGDVKCGEADAIVVVSGGDTKARTDEGIQLFENGWASAIVFSGAAQDKSGPSNAAAMRDRAVAAGIPEASIFVDEESATTEENAINTKTLLKENDFNRVILVTSGYHQKRAALEFNKGSGSVTIVNHPLVSDKDWSMWWWLTPRGWWLAGGEIVKIGAFYIQGTPS